MSEFVTPAELAKSLKVSERHVRALCTRGEIAGAVRIGRVWRIRLDDFDAACRRSCVRKVEPPQESAAQVMDRLYPARRPR